MRDVPVFLTGFMAVGKSRIGRLLARRWNRIFLDTDQMVVGRAGKAIARIFADEGEDHFRHLEMQCVAEACRRTDAVVALGGGAIASEENAAIILRTGVLAWIDADVDTILERVSRRDNRPLLAGLDRDQKRARIQELLESRIPYYRRAQVRVRSSEARTAQETADELLRALENWNAEH